MKAMYHSINLHFFSSRATLSVVEYCSMCRKKRGPFLLLVSVLLVSEAQFLFSGLIIQFNSIFLTYKPSMSPSSSSNIIPFRLCTMVLSPPPVSLAPSSLTLIITSEPCTVQVLFPQHSSQISPLS